MIKSYSVGRANPQSVALSEFCRVVNPPARAKREPSLGHEGEGHGSREDLGSTCQELSGVEEMECGDSLTTELEMPSLGAGDRPKRESERA